MCTHKLEVCFSEFLGFLSKKAHFLLDLIRPLCYTIRMKWNQTTVPTNVEERHDLSVLLGKAFAQAYKIHKTCEDTQQILEIYKASRRMVDCQPLSNTRYGSVDAYEATQGI